jgi:hypothetical protein
MNNDIKFFQKALENDNKNIKQISYSEYAGVAEVIYEYKKRRYCVDYVYETIKKIKII